MKLSSYQDISTPLIVVILLLAYLAFTLPYLNNYPQSDWAAMGIAAPAYNLANEGIYGNPLFEGWHKNERYNYEYMPLYPILVAGSFKLFGLGLWQGRLVSVISGLLTLVLVFWLGKLLKGKELGIIAMAVLLFLHLSVSKSALTGIPLIDYSKIIRYDILVAVFMLAGCITFYFAWHQRSRAGYFLAGIFTGLATLSHLYGAFALPLFISLLFWRNKHKIILRPPLYLIITGWVVCLIPWLVYIAQDFEAYLGQMQRHSHRFGFLDWEFYLQNIIREPLRYAGWFGSGGEFNLWPRIGIWVLILGLLISYLSLLKKRNWKFSEQFLFLSLPVLFILLALLMSFKRHYYTILLMPFIALHLAQGFLISWKWCRQKLKYGRRIIQIIAILIISESIFHIYASMQNAAKTTPYLAVTSQIASHLHPDKKILISQPYWLGLSSYKTVSVNLPWIMAYTSGDHDRLSMCKAIDSVNPEMIVIETEFLESKVSSDSLVHSLWQDFARCLAQHCQSNSKIKDPTYGEIGIYTCSW